MPLHLLPSRNVSRRHVLKTLAAGGAALALPGAARSARGADSTDSSDPPVERWALLADTHIPTDPDTAARGVNMSDHFRRVGEQLISEARQAPLEGVVINGDCAYLKGLRGDYENLARLLDPLLEAGLPVHLTMGNHDDRGPFYEVLADHQPERPPVDGQHVAILETPLVDWYLLDSLRFVDQVEGEFGEDQLEWLAERLAANPVKPAILVAHHYQQPQDPPGGEPRRLTGLVDTAEFARLLADHHQAKAFVFGHSHRWHVAADEQGCHLINLPPTAYVFDPQRPSGWVLATVTAGGMTLELRSLAPDHPEHARETALAWR